MPRLLLLRHAKAERSGKDSSRDHERSLTKRGRADSKEMGKMLAAQGEHPARILCSSSQRTRETWELVRPRLPGAPEPHFLREIYEADKDYLDILRRQGGGAASLLLVGHNPAIQETAIRLAADVAGADGRALKDAFPTAATAIFEFDGAWATLAPRTARLVAFLKPGGEDD
jgi:phosphohistidine phosphatase